MIELFLNNYYLENSKEDNGELDALMLLTNIIAWFLEEVKKAQKNIFELDENDGGINGIFIIRDDETIASALILCDTVKCQDYLIKILQEPPEKYKGKYIACVRSKEPDPISEKNDSDESDETTDEKDDKT